VVKMPVFLNLKKELQNDQFIEKDFSVSFKSLSLPEEYSSEKDSVDVHMYIIKEKDGYLVSLTINSDIKLECGRCLESFVMDLKGTSSIFLSKKKLDGDLEDEEHFNVSELLREEILVKTPMKPLCDEDCKGICPVCGSNRNENPCNCEQEMVREESPFAKLKTLLEKK